LLSIRDGEKRDVRIINELRLTNKYEHLVKTDSGFSKTAPEEMRKGALGCRAGRAHATLPVGLISLTG
jgi:hypothetical protein